MGRQPESSSREISSIWTNVDGHVVFGAHDCFAPFFGVALSFFDAELSAMATGTTARKGEREQSNCNSSQNSANY